MNSDTSQIKVTISKSTRQLLDQKASSIGISLTAYVKHLLYTDVKNGIYPIYIASDETDKLVAEAREANKLGKLKSFNSIEELDKLVDSVDDD